MRQPAGSCSPNSVAGCHHVTSLASSCTTTTTHPSSLTTTAATVDNNDNRPLHTTQVSYPTHHPPPSLPECQIGQHVAATSLGLMSANKPDDGRLAPNARLLPCHPLNAMSPGLTSPSKANDTRRKPRPVSILSPLPMRAQATPPFSKHPRIFEPPPTHFDSNPDECPSQLPRHRRQHRQGRINTMEQP